MKDNSSSTVKKNVDFYASLSEFVLPHILPERNNFIIIASGKVLVLVVCLCFIVTCKKPDTPRDFSGVKEQTAAVTPENTPQKQKIEQKQISGYSIFKNPLKENTLANANAYSLIIDQMVVSKWSYSNDMITISRNSEINDYQNISEVNTKLSNVFFLKSITLDAPCIIPEKYKDIETLISGNNLGELYKKSIIDSLKKYAIETSVQNGSFIIEGTHITYTKNEPLTMKFVVKIIE